MINSIKEHEGFNGMPYKDHLGNHTIGYGTLLPLSEQEAEILMNNRLTRYIQELEQKLPWLKEHSLHVKEVLYEMAYQLGIPKLLNFKKTLKLVEQKNYLEASLEMLDSKWYKQTPRRAEILSRKLAQSQK